jgi:hypothetical protein
MPPGWRSRTVALLRKPLLVVDDVLGGDLVDELELSVARVRPETALTSL